LHHAVFPVPVRARSPSERNEDPMTYTVTDIAELISYHLVASADDDSSANANLADLVGRIQSMSTAPLFQPVEWLFCDRCACAVDTVLINEDGAGYADDGDFLCSSCRWGDEE
jgi:hypothetical protein